MCVYETPYIPRMCVCVCALFPGSYNLCTSKIYSFSIIYSTKGLKSGIMGISTIRHYLCVFRCNYRTLDKNLIFWSRGK